MFLSSLSPTIGVISAMLIILAIVILIAMVLHSLLQNFLNRASKTELLNYEGTVLSVEKVTLPPLVQPGLLGSFPFDDPEEYYEYQLSVKCSDSSIIDCIRIGKDLYENVYKAIITTGKKIRVECQKNVYMEDTHLLNASLC